MPYLLSSKTLVMSVAIGIRHSVFHNSTFHMLDYFTDDRLLALKVFTCLRKSYLSSTVGQTRLSITIINIERPYANCIFQESMDWITDIFGKRKRKIAIFFFSRHLNLRSDLSVHTLIILLHCVKRIGLIALIMS